MAQEKVPLLIVGGGIVGLSASLFLLHQGIPSLLVERHATTSILPRARGIHFRTMEFYREIGLDEAIQAAGASVIKQGKFGGFLIGKTLICAERQKLAMSAPLQPGANGAMQDLSPANFCFCPQDTLEPLLLETARQRGGDLRFNTELVSFEQDETGVTAFIRERTSDTQYTQYTVRAEYLIAADGARSPIRKMLSQYPQTLQYSQTDRRKERDNPNARPALTPGPIYQGKPQRSRDLAPGVSQSGQGTLEHYLNIYFQADLSEQVRGKEFSQCLIEHPDGHRLLVSINNTDRWVLHVSYHPERGEKPDDFPPERCKELVREAIGLSKIEVEILSIGPWESAVRIADGFQHGRVFLVGDAAHLMPPWGGFGADTGIADVHNLTWKLAAALSGQATPALLHTYDVERRPVAHFAAEQSALRSDVRIRYGLGSAEETADVQKKLVGMVVVVGGYQYRSQAVIADDEAPTVLDELLFDGRPGTRAPHTWVEYQGRPISTLDLLWRGFVLLTGSEGNAWYEAARSLADRLDIELDTYRVGPAGELFDPECYWQDLAGIQADGALLMRPDGIVAWRAWESVAEPERVLEQVMMHILCRGSV